GSDPALAAALAGPIGAVQPTLRQLGQRDGLARLELLGPGGKPVATFSRGRTVADAALSIRGPGGTVSTLIVSGTTASDFLAQARQLSGAELVLAPGSTEIATSQAALG